MVSKQLHLAQGIVLNFSPIYIALIFIHSDATGLGYILLLNDQPMLFAPDKFIGNRLGSYGRTFQMTVRVDDGPFGPGILLDTIIR